MRKILVLTFFLYFHLNIYSQFYHKVEANISVKTKYYNGKGTLEMGKVYFNKRVDKLLYDFTFPEKQQIAFHDTLIYIINKDKTFEKIKTVPFIKSTLFNIILTGDLLNYGMKNNTIFLPIKVVKENGLTITTWSMKNKKLGDIKVATKSNELVGVVFFNTKGEIMSKQVFNNYIIVSGIKFPTEIIQIFYNEGKENYQVTTFKNIVINNSKNENFYNFSIPR